MKKKLLLLLFLLTPLLTYAQHKISGSVKDAAGMAIPGVQVQEKNTNNGTLTDMEGNFNMEVQDDAALVFSFLGYKTQEIEVAGQRVIAVTLFVVLYKSVWV
jgi:iron complex outermembrane receptor protein